ncbi:uncharacterized protein [Narcine bancroftii]|uniref:uncharacterized protein isoform X2 n=1 Tax=Narcine bancroftii TaxID=1343680 RepID=UPI003831BD3C
MSNDGMLHMQGGDEEHSAGAARCVRSACRNMKESCIRSGRGAPDSAERLRALVWEMLRAREYSRATTLLETCRVEAKEEIGTLWYEVQYMKLMEQLGSNKLTAVQRFRCRKRNPLPHSLRLEGPRTRRLPPEARQRLIAWARGNTANPTGKEREKLVKETGLKRQQVCNWFANYRRKLRKANGQEKSVGEVNLSYTAVTHPWMLVNGRPQLDLASNKADFEWIECEQITVKQPGFSNPQCCQGWPSHHLLLGEMEPTISLAAAAGRWCWTGAASTHMSLCPCLPLTVNLGPVPEALPTPQPDGLLQGGGESGRAAALWRPCSGEGSLHQGRWGLQNGNRMSWHHPFGDRHQAGTGMCQEADGAIDAHQHLTWADVGEVNPTLPEGSFQTDLSWQISLSNASHLQGLNWSSEWTVGMHSAEKSQNPAEGVMPVCRSFSGTSTWQLRH